MFPLIDDRFFGFTIKSYSLFAALGLAFGLVVIIRAGLRAGLERKKLTDLVLWVVVASIVGAKLTQLLVESRSFVAEDWVFVSVLGQELSLPRPLARLSDGLVYYGGLIFGGIAAIIYTRRRTGWSVGTVLDVIAPGVALGHVWGRMGCFLAGCCYGKATDSTLGVAFSHDSHAFEQHAAQGLLLPPNEATYPLHPVQLYEGAIELLISGALILCVHSRRRIAGQIALISIGCYSVARFFLEIYRGDHRRGFLGDPVASVAFNRWIGVDGGSPSLLSVSQCIALVVVLTCGFIWLLLSQRLRRSRRKSVTFEDSAST